MPSYEDYARDYHAPDRDEVLAGIQKYGTDDRNQWQDAPPPPPPQSQNQGQPVGQGQPPPPPTIAGQWNQGGKLADDQAYNGLSRDQFRDQTMNQTWANPAEMQAYMQARGATKVSDNGTYRDPWGRILDMGIGAKSGGPIKGAWTPTGLDGPINNGAPQAIPGGLNYSAVMPSNPPETMWAGGNPGAPGAPGTGDLRNDLVKRLMERSQQSLTLDKNDPMIRAQVDPYAAQMERASRNYVADVAERSGPGANIRGEQRLASEHAGQAAGQKEADTIGNEISARRNEIAQALSGLQGELTNEQQQALSRELAQLNAEISRRGQDINWQQALMQNDQFGRSLAQSGSQFDRQLAQSGSQFDKDLGLRAEDRYNYWDTLRSGLQ